jgi:hypothetical protein
MLDGASVAIDRGFPEYGLLFILGGVDCQKGLLLFDCDYLDIV